MFNSKFTYWLIVDVPQDFDLAERHSNVLKSQYKHNIAIAVHSCESQYDDDSHYWSLCMLIVRTFHPQDMSNHLRPLTLVKICFVGGSFYFLSVSSTSLDLRSSIL